MPSHYLKTARLTSQIAFLVIFVAAVGIFYWWVSHRPSFLLTQARSHLGKQNQSAVISEYHRLLKKPNLSQEEEIRLRSGLGEFYLDANTENTTVFVTGRLATDYDIQNPFLEAAKKEFDRILALDPRHAGAHYNLGRIYWMRNLERYALEEMNLSRQFDPQDPRPLYSLAVIYNERGDPSKGKELALQALAIKPDFDQSRLALIDAYSLLGEMDKAFQEFEKLSYTTRTTPYVQAKNALQLADQNYWIEADREMEAAVRGGGDEGQVRVYYGRLLLLKGRFEEASAEFVYAANFYRHSAWPLVWQGLTFATRGECQEAQRMSNLLGEALPRWNWTQLVRASAYHCLGEGELCDRSLEEAVGRAPEFKEAIQMRARLFLDNARYEALGKFLRPLLDKDIFKSMAYSFLAESFYYQGLYDMSIETAQMALAANNRNQKPYIWLGLSYYQKGELAAGERAFNQAINLTIFDPELNGCYGYFKVLQKEDVLGRRIIDEAKKLYPRHAELSFIQGEIERKVQHFPEAIQAYSNALFFKPYLLKAQLGLIDSYWKMGDKKAADLALSTSLKINSQNKDVLFWKKKIRGSSS